MLFQDEGRNRPHRCERASHRSRRGYRRKNHQGLDKSQASTKEAIWLNEHAAEYGFILRFPQDKVAITGISYESWHFRYVGEEAAKFMKENNLCLEEFVELAKAQQEQEALKEAEME